MESWDSLCLNKGPTLTVVETSNGCLIGGFTSKSMTRSNNDWSYTEDDKAWIFSLDKKVRLRIK